MTSTLSIHSPEVITKKMQGVYKFKVDPKKRIHIPTAWKDDLSPGTKIHFMNAGAYFILATQIEISDPDIIVVSHEISNDGRLVLGGKLENSFGIKIGTEVGLIGKGNHVELYTDINNYDDAIRRSQSAARNFQAKLLGIL